MRFGLVGTGHWAGITHAPALATTPGVALTSVWGRDRLAAQALAARHGATAHPDFDAFLDSVDAVAFAVPPHVQAPLAIRAAEAGKHLLLEKPIALSAETADELVAAVEKAKVASVVFFTWRFNLEIRAWLADEQARGGWSGSGWSGGVAIWLGTSLQPGSPFNTPWRQEKGALWDLGPHMVAMLWACLGRVTAVTAIAGLGDVAHLVLRHEGGASSTATMTQGAPEAASGSNLFVWGAAGRSVMPALPDDPEQSLRVAAAELVAAANAGQVHHPCDVRFGRDVVEVLAKAEAQLAAHPLSSCSDQAGHCTCTRVSA
jgi:predicted dehydrogenase